MQQKEERRSIMLTAETHKLLSGYCKELSCTHTQMVEAMLTVIEKPGVRKAVDKEIEAMKAEIEKDKRKRRELAEKIASLPEDEIKRLLEQIG